MSDPSFSIVPSHQTSAAYTKSTPSNSQDYNKAGYKKPTVEDFDEEGERKNIETGITTSDEAHIGRTPRVDIQCRRSRRRRRRKATNKRRLIVREQAERFLRTVPAAISARVWELMVKMARGEEVKDSEEDEKSDEDDMDGWGHITKMVKEVKRRHEEELIKYWMAKAVKE